MTRTAATRAPAAPASASKPSRVAQENDEQYSARLLGLVHDHLAAAGHRHFGPWALPGQTSAWVDVALARIYPSGPLFGTIGTV